MIYKEIQGREKQKNNEESGDKLTEIVRRL